MQRISELEESQKNVAVECIVLKYMETKTTKDGDRIVIWLVGDESGTIEFGVWNCSLDVGDVIQVAGGYVSVFQEKKRLFVSRIGAVSRVGVFRKTFLVSECHVEMMYQ